MSANPSRASAGPGGPAFSAEQRRSIHRAAQAAVIATVRGLPIRIADPSLAGAADLPTMGAFVTLRRRGELRACCGVLGRPMRVADALVRAARRTALEDLRLPPVSPTELPFLDLHVSLLYGFREVEEEGEGRERAIEVGRHGLQIRRGEQAGLLLPSVAADQGMDAREFLRAVCRKAGLPARPGATIPPGSRPSRPSPSAARSRGMTGRPRGRSSTWEKSRDSRGRRSWPSERWPAGGWRRISRSTAPTRSSPG